LFTDAEIIIDGVVFALDAVGVRGTATLHAVGVTAVTCRRVVDNIDEVICTALMHAAVVLTIVLTRQTVRQTVGCTRLTQLMARNAALYIHTIISYVHKVETLCVCVYPCVFASQFQSQMWLVVWHSGRMSVSGRQTFPVLTRPAADG